MPLDLHVRNLVKLYGEVRAVDGLSFEIKGGEIFGLLGPNGAGKTTTIECILGLRQPDSGEIRIGEIDATREPDKAKQLIGASLQSTALQDKITPREAIKLLGSFYRHSISASQLIERFSLDEKADAAYDTLSGGQKQRLALALAFVNDPELLFLDEPTAGLDPQSRRELIEMILKMRQEGRTILLSTHDLQEAHQICDRIAMIHHGRLAAMGKPDELIAAAKMTTRVSVKTSRPLDPARLASLPAVSHVQPNRDGWQMETTDPAKTAMALLKLLEMDENELLDLQIYRPTLEEVFLQTQRAG